MIHRLRAACTPLARGDDRGSASAFVVAIMVALLVIAGLVADGGRAINARVAIADDAEQAARVAANQIDQATLRGGGRPQIDPVMATSKALDFLALRGYATSRASVRADVDAVTVTVSDDVPTGLLQLVMIDTFTVEGTATARAAVGIDDRDRRPMMDAEREARLTGPQRFQDPAGVAEPRSVGAGLGAAVLLLLLVAGIPVGLVLLGAVPAVPTSWPDRIDVMAAIGVEQVLAVLVWVVWLAWLQFTICVAVELRSALSGVGLPARVPMAGPSQRLARTLVVSVLLLVTAAGQATAAVAPTHHADMQAPVSISASVVPGTVSETPSAPAGAAAEAVAAHPGGDDVLARRHAAQPRRGGRARGQAGVRRAAARGALPRQPLGHRGAHDR